MTRRPELLPFAALLTGLLSSCAGKVAPPEPTAPSATRTETGDHDPWEGLNRNVFWFNDKVDTYVLEPVAKGWAWVAPEKLRDSLSNFFVNLRFPIVATNNLLQGKVKSAGSDVGRFLVNTTVGVLGFMDPASRWGLEQHYEDFGQTLGWWGVGAGPYLVLPLLGPSSPRDTLGLVGDYPMAITPFFVDSFILLGARTADIVNMRSLYLQQVRDIKNASLDYYTFVRNAYLQRRAVLLNDQGEITREQEEDLYHPELGEP